jgi:hypothetical protein
MVRKKKPEELTDSQAIRHLFPPEVVRELDKPGRQNTKRKAPGQRGKRES